MSMNRSEKLSKLHRYYGSIQGVRAQYRDLIVPQFRGDAERRKSFRPKDEIERDRNAVGQAIANRPLEWRTR